MKQLGKQLATLAVTILTLAACSENNSNYPDEYVGFDKVKVNFSFDRTKDSQEISVKVIAAEKKDKDREVRITGILLPEEESVYSITNNKLIIPAKKKSAGLQIKIFPKKIKKQKEIRLVCTPQSKDAKKTQLIIRLTPQ